MVQFCDTNMKPATRTATRTEAPHRIMSVSMRHQRRLECVSSARSNLSCRLSARSLYSHSALGAGYAEYVEYLGYSGAVGAVGSAGAAGVRDQSVMRGSKARRWPCSSSYK